jgi:uncharacterized protein
MIPQSQLSKLSNRLLRENGGKRIPEKVLERDYCISWFLMGLSRTSLKDKIIFKGGTALRRCYFHDYRFSEDLDFTLLQSIAFDELKLQLEFVYEEIKEASNITFSFSRIDPNSHRNSYTFYLTYDGPLPVSSFQKEIKVDITISEKVFYSPSKVVILKCDEFYDLPSDADGISVYTLNEIASEKTVALLDRARTEPRDLYDLWYLTDETRSVSIVDCLDAIHAKLLHRGNKLDGVSNEFHRKEARLMKTWETRLAPQMSSIPKFDSVYRGVKRVFRQAKII